MINEINSIRRRYIQNYLRLIQGLEVNTEIVGITPEAELRKLDVVGATNEIVDITKNVLRIIHTIRLSLVLSDPRINK